MSKLSLLRIITNRIKSNGPISIADYMRECLFNPEKGYYTNQRIFGQQGDFITSPEISQVFGELIGVWFINEWQQQSLRSHSDQWRFVELGPGRATLLCDVIRTWVNFPDALRSCQIHLVEASPRLQRVQLENLDQLAASLNSIDSKTQKLPYATTSQLLERIHWHSSVDELLLACTHENQTMPTFVMANEFFDAMPIHVFKRVEKLESEGEWREILVDTNDSDNLEHNREPFKYSLASNQKSTGMIACKPVIETIERHYQKQRDQQLQNHKQQQQQCSAFPPFPDTLEISIDALDALRKLVKLLESSGSSAGLGASLIIDYGPDQMGPISDSLRAFQKHQQVHALSHIPGEADLTTDVDFWTIKAYFDSIQQAEQQTGNFQLVGPVDQRNFLAEMGLAQRLKILLTNQTDSKKRSQLISGCRMLMDEEQMGKKFKFLSILPNSRCSKIVQIPGFSALNK